MYSSLLRRTQGGCGGLGGENPAAFPQARPIFQQPFSLPESAQTLAGIAFRAAGKSGNNFPAALKFFAGKPFQQGILDSHSLLELSELQVLFPLPMFGVLRRPKDMLAEYAMWMRYLGLESFMYDGAATPSCNLLAKLAELSGLSPTTQGILMASLAPLPPLDVVRTSIQNNPRP